MSRNSERAHIKRKTVVKCQRATKGAANRAAKTLQGKKRKKVDIVAELNKMPLDGYYDQTPASIYKDSLEEFNDSTYAIKTEIKRWETYRNG